jgi:1-pyrroline-5-carboxylate dehydrogenase
MFAEDRAAMADGTRALRFSAGSFYINDKPTGAVVGQQPIASCVATKKAISRSALVD